MLEAERIEYLRQIPQMAGRVVATGAEQGVDFVQPLSGLGCPIFGNGRLQGQRQVGHNIAHSPAGTAGGDGKQTVALGVGVSIQGLSDGARLVGV